jgi:hypothetical protein
MPYPRQRPKSRPEPPPVDPRTHPALSRYVVDEQLNLAGADLSGADLAYARLPPDCRGVILSKANLYRAHLSGVNLADANLTEANLGDATLVYTRFTGANLRNADLRQVDGEIAVFDRADLSGADLSFSDLHAATFKGAVLERTKLSGARLTGANLEGVHLAGVRLGWANLTGARLDGAKADSTTRLVSTILADVTLSPFCGDVVVAGPCHVDFKSVVRSIAQPRLKEFLVKSGMPEVFAQYMISCAETLDPGILFSLFQSTFISYGGPDEAFAEKLNDALEAEGVRTFLFKDDAPPGERLHRVMRTGVNSHDRVILICSKASLDRKGVLAELEETLAREARDGGATYLLPVRLDDYVIDGWNPSRSDLVQTVQDRVIADFRNHTDHAEFAEQVGRLISVLKRPLSANPGGADPPR